VRRTTWLMIVVAVTAAPLVLEAARLGRPIIQYPQDMVAMQELIWELRPDLIIETGIDHGGSIIYSASMLALLDLWMGVHPAPLLELIHLPVQLLTGGGL